MTINPWTFGGNNGFQPNTIANFGTQNSIAPPPPATPLVPQMPNMPEMSRSSIQEGINQRGMNGVNLPNGAQGGQGFWGQMGGFEGLGNIAQGISSLGQVWGAVQGVKLAREQLDFSKQAYQTNLENSTQSYNTALEDRIRSRYHTEGRAEGSADNYLAQHSL